MAMPEDEDMTGVYAEDRGDTCTARKTRWWGRGGVYDIVCALGTRRAVDGIELRSWIERGWYCLLKAGKSYYPHARVD